VSVGLLKDVAEGKGKRTTSGERFTIYSRLERAWESAPTVMPHGPLPMAG
jgi:hypothetical protein